MTTVSAIVATYNRADVLREALRRLMAQSCPPDEIIVVDDASPDNTRAVVQTEFPNVRYVRMPKNMGWTYNRNLGVMSTRGELILSLDDDAWFEDDDGLARAIARFEQDSAIGVIALNVRLPNGWLFFPTDAAPRPVSAYIGCACFMRRDVAERTLYIPQMLCQEEADRSLRVYDLGKTVLGLPDVVIYHALSTKNRNWERFRFMIHRSGLIRELARCPLALLPWRFLVFWAGQTLSNMREGFWLVDLKILWRLPWIVHAGLSQRAPVRLKTYRAWRAMVRRERRELPPGQGERQIGGSNRP